MGSLVESRIPCPPGGGLSSPRLLLRGAREGDAAELHKAFSDPEVMRYWSTLPHQDLATTEKWVQGMAEAPCNGTTDFVVCLKDPSEGYSRPVGKMGVWRDQEIGFLLSRSCWGQGLAREGLGLVLQHLFVDLRFEDVVADVDPRNEACLGFLRKMGFEVYDAQERTFQVGEEWVDSTYLRLTRKRWEMRCGVRS